MARDVFAVSCLMMLAVTATTAQKGSEPTPPVLQAWEKEMLKELRDLKGMLATRTADQPRRKTVLEELLELKDVLAAQRSKSWKTTALEELLDLKGLLTTPAAQYGKTTVLDELIELKGGLADRHTQKTLEQRFDDCRSDINQLRQQAEELALKTRALEEAVATLMNADLDLKKASQAVEEGIADLKNASEALEYDVELLWNSNDELRQQQRGTSYIRWGHTGCPQSSELVYTGIVGGSHYYNKGGAANHLCMTPEPVFENEQPPGKTFAKIHGSEYEYCPDWGCETTPACAVCRVPRAATIMIPGTNSCTSGWTLEYSGYIMAGNPDHTGSSEYICVDSSHGTYGSGSIGDDNLLYHTRVDCGALSCPPYKNDKIVTCVVCSK